MKQPGTTEGPVISPVTPQGKLEQRQNNCCENFSGPTPFGLGLGIVHKSAVDVTEADIKQRLGRSGHPASKQIAAMFPKGEANDQSLDLLMASGASSAEPVVLARACKSHSCNLGPSSQASKRKSCFKLEYTTGSAGQRRDIDQTTLLFGSLLETNLV